jgi:hypothetical protein
LRDSQCEKARISRSVAVFLSAAVAIGCADPTASVQSTVHADASLALAAACATPTIRGRTFAAPGNNAPLELRVAVGDTARLSRSLSSSLPSTATAIGWKLEDARMARLEGDLVIPLEAGRTRLTANVAGRAFCVGLTVMFTGASVTALTVNESLLPLAADAGTRVGATLRFSNGFSMPVQGAAVWESLDPAVAGVSPSAWLTPRSDGTARIVASMGSFADTATLRIGTQPQLQSVQPRRAGDFTGSIGVNIHLSYFDRVYGSEFRTIIVPRLRELGVRHLRDGGTVLPNEDWMKEVYGRWRETADATGAQFTVIMSPRRTATGPGTNYTDVSHLRELSDRIGAGRIAAWEGLNEHDLTGRPEFARETRDMQRATYQFVKANPDLAARHRVIGPSIVNMSVAGQVGDLSAYMDEGAIHPYDGGQVPGTNLRSHADGIRPVSGNRALQATEVGYHTAHASTNPWHWALNESAQAKYTLRQFLELFNAGVTRSFAYELIDEGTDPADMEQFFGLLRNDGSRKPAFEALRNLIALLDDRTAPAFATRPLRVNISGDTAGVHRLLLEKADGRRYLVLWQNTLSYDKVNRRDVAATPRTVGLAFEGTLSMANVYIPLSGFAATVAHRQVRTLSLSVSDHPVVVELVD